MSKEAVVFCPNSMGESLKDCIREASNAKVQIEAHNDHIKDIRNRAKEEMGVEPKMFNQLLKLFHAQQRDAFDQEATEVLDVYDSIF